MGTMCTHEA